MIRQISGILVIALSIRFAVGQTVDAITSETNTDKSILMRMEREWNDALQKRDVDWYEKNLAHDLTDISSGTGALRTKMEDIEILKTDKTSYDTLELSNMAVRIEGNAGIVTGVNRITGRDEEGQPFDFRFAFTDTYIKRGGRWQVWASQHTRMK